jgi:hypothetical protein
MSIKSPLLLVRGVAHVKSRRIEFDVDREPVLFVRGVARVKSIRVKWDIDREPLAFCTQRCTCKKYKDRMKHQLRPPCLF